MHHTIRQIWSLFTAKERRRALGALLLIVLMAITETLGVLSIAPFLSVLARPSIAQENYWLSLAYHWFGFTRTSDFIMAMGFTTMGVVISASAFKTLTFHRVGRFVHFQRHALSARLLATYLHQPYEFFLTRNPAELGKNVLAAVDQLTFELLQPLTQLIAQGAVAFAILLLVLLYDPWMALSIVAIIGLLYTAIYLLVRKRLAHIGVTHQASNSDRYKNCSEVLGGIKDVKITHATEAYLQNFAQASREFSRHSATAETLSQSPLYIVEAVGYSGLIVIALVLLWRSGDLAHVLPTLGLYGFAAYRLLPAAQIMYRGFARLRFSSATLSIINHDLNLPAEPLTSTAGMLIPQREISLHGVDYAYPAAPDKLVLQNFNLTIKANTTIGIIGKSGAGKSTIMDILLGLITPQSGTLNIDNIEISAQNTRAWQRSIGYVPQHIYLADASVAENIAFGIPAAQIDMQAVERAARAAQIHDLVIHELPQGYATTIGERGIRLSGGQRQRIGIARALYRDPPVLLMDEATSALDTETEQAVNMAIRRLAGNKTIVVIAHREASLSSCQEIIRVLAPDNKHPRNQYALHSPYSAKQ